MSHRSAVAEVFLGRSDRGRFLENLMFLQEIGYSSSRNIQFVTDFCDIFMITESFDFTVLEIR